MAEQPRKYEVIKKGIIRISRFTIWHLRQTLLAGMILLSIGINNALAIEMSNDSVDVDLLSGSSNYKIPIEVPPGTNGMQPNLALVYNSGAGNGWVGEGWNLDGLGFVERFGPGWSLTPGYNSNDTFRLNFRGNSYKLIKDQTGIFHTENETFLKIESLTSGGLDYWLITDQSGTKFYFGNTVDSRQKGAPPSGVSAYHINKIVDTHGNFMTIVYDQDATNLDMYPKQIVYTQNTGLGCSPSNLSSCRTINFFTETRPDLSDRFISYQTGIKVVRDQRLKTIEVKMGDRLVRKYTLEYTMSTTTARELNRVSQLTNITEGGADGTNLPETTFTYNVGNDSRRFAETLMSNSPVPLVQNDCVSLVDIDNDGQEDVLWGGSPEGIVGQDGTRLPIDPPYYQYYPISQSDTGFNNAVTIPQPATPLPHLCSLRFEKRRKNIVMPIDLNGGETAEVRVKYSVLVPAHEYATLDFDGDGWTDVIDGKTAGNWGWWRNKGKVNGIVTFADRVPITPSPTVALADTDSVTVEDGTFNGRTFYRRTVQFVDMDGDSLVDIVQLDKTWMEENPYGAGPGGGIPGESTWRIKWWRNQGNGNLDPTSTSIENIFNWATEPARAPSYPPDTFITTSPWNIRLLDMNDDGLPDFASASQYSDGSGYRIYYRPNLGGGRSFGDRIAMTRFDGEPLVSSPLESNVICAEFVDVNGDGLLDIICPVIGVGSHYYPNRGDGSFGNRIGLDGVPPPTVFYSPLDPEHNFPIPDFDSIKMADIDGDGFVDIVQTPELSDFRLYRLPRGDNHRLLETAKSPFGGTATVTYRREIVADGSVWAVSQIDKSNGLGNDPNMNNAGTYIYTYSGGLNVGWPYNEFRGFRSSKVTDLTGATTETWFHQDIYRKGRIEAVEVRGAVDPNGGAPLLTRTEYSYVDSDSVPNVVFRADLTAEIIKTYDQQAGASLPFPIVKRTEYSDFDSYGQPRTITFGGARTNTRITRTDFLYNDSAYIVNRPSYIETLVGGITIEKKWFAYDGLAEGVPPSTKGDLTQERHFFSEGNHPVIQYAYDSFGNRIGTIDAKNNKCSATGYTTKIDYDTTYRTFPVSEINALCQVTNKTYWGMTPGITPRSGAYEVHGLLATETDPNNVKTEFYWDVHSRPHAKVIPPDNFQFPTELWIYDITGTAPSSTTEKRRDESPLGGGTLERITYVDGLNRTIQTKAEAEQSGQWITQDTNYNSRGLVESLSIPYLTSGRDYSTPQPQPKTTTLYDAMRRPIEVTNPDGTKRTANYFKWTVTNTDEKGYKTILNYDDLNRLISVVENSPGGTTLYSYDNFDGAGNNRQTITDATELNITTTIFDTLGRKKSQTDPDLGAWSFTYDPNGNLLTQTDAKGQMTTFVYDKLNRVKTKIMNGPDSTAPVLSTPSAGGITATGAVISWTTDEYADSLVEYGTTTAYGSTSGDADFITSHAVNLSGLSNATLYHYRVKSRDPAGNLTTSSDRTFTTGSNPPPDTTPPTISSVASSSITSTGATITWTTNEASDTQVEYGTTTSYGSSTTLNTSMVTNHSAALSGLSASTLYHYRVKSKDAAGNLATSADFTLTTSANPILTLTKSGTGSGSVTSSPAGINCGATCSASFAPGTSVTLTAAPAAGATFGGFSGGCVSATTTCIFTITANATVTATFNDTQAPTAPSSLTATVASSTQINLTWTASTDNVGVTGYRVDRCQGASCTNFAQIATPTGASFNNTSLTAGTTYRYRVRAADAAGNLSAYSNIVSATTTASDTTPPTISNVASGSITSTGATITWTTNEASDTQVEYGTTTSYGSSTTLNTAMVTSHNATLSGLSASTLYHYRVKSRDAAGNLATSADFTFTTSAGTAGIDLIMTSVIGPNSGQIGGSIVITNVVNNQGGSAAGGFEVRLMLSPDQTITASDTVLSYRNVSSLAAGASNSANTAVTLPNGMTPGTYYLGALVDIQNLVPEDNETNNSLAGNTIAIVIGEDLVITAVSGPASGQMGGSITITNTVQNQGIGQAGGFEVRLFLSPDQTITASDTVLSYRNVSSLAAGASNSANTTVTIPSGLTPGTYYIGALVDIQNLVPEDNETNNSLAGNTINVTP